MTQTNPASKRTIFPSEIKAVGPGKIVCLEFRLNNALVQAKWAGQAFVALRRFFFADLMNPSLSFVDTPLFTL